jgi:hypothetical protein
MYILYLIYPDLAFLYNVRIMIQSSDQPVLIMDQLN